MLTIECRALHAVAFFYDRNQTGFHGPCPASHRTAPFLPFPRLPFLSYPRSKPITNAQRVTPSFRGGRPLPPGRRPDPHGGRLRLLGHFPAIWAHGKCVFRRTPSANLAPSLCLRETGAVKAKPRRKPRRSVKYPKRWERLLMPLTNRRPRHRWLLAGPGEG